MAPVRTFSKAGRGFGGHTCRASVCSGQAVHLPRTWLSPASYTGLRIALVRCRMGSCVSVLKTSL